MHEIDEVNDDLADELIDDLIEDLIEEELENELLEDELLDAVYGGAARKSRSAVGNPSTEATVKWFDPSIKWG